MTKKKAPKREYVAKIDLNTTFAELVPARKKGRAPKQIGQGRNKGPIRLHSITQKELKKRLDNAEAILKTGSLPKEAKKKEEFFLINPVTHPAEDKSPGYTHEHH